MIGYSVIVKHQESLVFAFKKNFLIIFMQRIKSHSDFSLKKSSELTADFMRSNLYTNRLQLI